MDGSGEIVRYGSYEEFRGILSAELQQEAESFVRIGYLLKVARDTDILAESGYGTVAEFASAEYGLTKDIVSRYIAINDKYSEGGYSENLQEKYRGYGYSKLAEMLTLPAAVAEEIPPEATRAEIQELKKEIRDERQVSPMEIMAEEQQDEERPMIYRMLREYYHGKPAEYETVHEAVSLRKPYDDMGYYVSTAKDLLAPSGNVIMMSRVPGVGRVMLVVSDGGRPELLNVRTSEKTPCSWEAIVDTLLSLCPFLVLEDSWEQIYGEPYPMAEAVKEERAEKAARAVKVSKKPDGRAKKKDPGKKKAQERETGKETEKEAAGAPKGQQEAENPAREEPAECTDVQPGSETVQAAMAESRPPGPLSEPEGDKAPEEQPDEGRKRESAKILNARHLAKVTLDAIDKGRFMSARRAARHLIEVLAEICAEQEAMDIEGQMDMGDMLNHKI